MSAAALAASCERGILILPAIWLPREEGKQLVLGPRSIGTQWSRHATTFPLAPKLPTIPLLMLVCSFGLTRGPERKFPRRVPDCGKPEQDWYGNTSDWQPLTPSFPFAALASPNELKSELLNLLSDVCNWCIFPIMGERGRGWQKLGFSFWMSLPHKLLASLPPCEAFSCSELRAFRLLPASRPFCKLRI
eukprot:748378-Hanusia_phi.AAC.6